MIKFDFTVKHMPRGESHGRSRRASANATTNTIINVGHTLDVCLILVYALNIIVVLRRLIMRSKSEYSVDSTD